MKLLIEGKAKKIFSTKEKNTLVQFLNILMKIELKLILLKK